MLTLNDFARKFSTVRRLTREEGIGSVISIALERADLRLKLLATRIPDSVTLDGCTINLKQMPDTPMKLALLRGEYEAFERHAILQYADTNQPVIELGGCIGVVACVTNRILKHPKSHVVVEANPHAVPFLEESRRRNQCEFEILNAAIAYEDTSVTFSPATDFWGNSLRHRNDGTTVTVPATRLQDIIERRGFDSFTLICDIEGHEYDLVLNEADVLRKTSLMILETHARLIGEAKTLQMLRKLNDLGFRVISQESAVFVMTRSPV